MDSVLTSTTPRVTTTDAVAIAATAFGVAADAARDLGSERDRTFALLDAGGTAVAVLKVSNAAESADVLAMEAAAALHITAVDRELRVALPWRPATTGAAGPARAGDAPSDLRAEYVDGETPHLVRL
jgi:Ser/Thr protein kinase RdoA (MazF antagonist)